MQGHLSINDKYRLAFSAGYTREQDLSAQFRSATSGLENPASWLINLLNGADSQSGIPINDETSQRLAAVYACNRVLAETIGSMPVGLYRKIPNGGAEPADRRPEHKLLAFDPAPDFGLYTPVAFFETALYHMGLRGNFYARIYRDGRGTARNLRILHPDHVRPFAYKGKLYYETTPYPEWGYDEPRETHQATDIFHVAYLGFNGIKGKNPLEVLRDTIGIGLGNTRYVANIQKQGGQVRGILVHPNSLNPEQIAGIRANFKNPLLSGDIPLLQNGLEYKSIALNPHDAEFINTHKLTRNDIATAYRVPLHKINDLDRATFSNIENQQIQFVSDTIVPIIRKFEAEARRKLLPFDLQGDHFYRFNVNALLRGDMLSRTRAYAIARQWGWLNADEIRNLEDLNPLPDGQGEIYLTPLNMVPADMVEDQFANNNGDGNTDQNNNTNNNDNGTAQQPNAA